MKIKSRDFGEIEIDKKDIVEFPKGIPGFLKQKEYVFLPLEEESPFVIMQSVNKEDLAFVTIEPGNFFTDYEFDVDENTEKMLNLENIDDVTVFNIVTLRNKMENITVNLAAPLLINFSASLGRQVILDDDEFPLRRPLFTGEKKSETVVQ